MKTGIIGAGRIGSELYRRAKSLGWDIKFVLKDDGIYRLSGQGAGARPTTSSMIKDAIKLFHNNNS